MFECLQSESVAIDKELEAWGLTDTVTLEEVRMGITWKWAIQTQGYLPRHLQN